MQQGFDKQQRCLQSAIKVVRGCHLLNQHIINDKPLQRRLIQRTVCFSSNFSSNHYFRWIKHSHWHSHPAFSFPETCLHRAGCRWWFGFMEEGKADPTIQIRRIWHLPSYQGGGNAISVIDLLPDSHNSVIAVQMQYRLGLFGLYWCFFRTISRILTILTS